MPLLTGNGSQLGASVPAVGSATIESIISGTFLTDACDIQRMQEFDDGQGSVSEQWITIASDIACWLGHATSEIEKLEGRALEAQTRFQLLLPLGTDIEPTDRVLKDGLLYQVVDSDSGITRAIYLTVYLVRIRNEFAG